MIAAHQTMMAPPALPYDAEVEYLSSDGSQWVDTGFAPTFPSNLEYRARILWPNTTTRKIMGLQGGMYIGVCNGKYQPALGGTNTVNATVSANVVHDFGAVFHLTRDDVQLMSQVGWTMDNLSGTTSSQLYNYLPAGSPIWIFAANDASGLRGASRVYSFQILVNGTLVRDYIPVRKGATGYLFDRVSGELFGNAGTGAFTIGSDKT